MSEHEPRRLPRPREFGRELMRGRTPSDLLRGRTPSEPLPLSESALRLTPYRHLRPGAQPEQDTGARQALELAVRVGELMLRCGAGTRTVESTVVAVAAAAGLRRLEVDITNQSLLVQAPAPSGEPLTLLRVVRSSTRDFARLAAVHEFVADVVRDGIEDVADANDRLKSIQRERRFYQRWMISVAYAVLAGSVCALLGGGSMATVVAVLAALVIDAAEVAVDKCGLPGFYAAAAGGLIATTLAWMGYLIAAKGVLGLQMSTADFAYAVAAGIVIMLPGRAMAAAVEDAITGYPVTGAGRLLTVALTTSGIIVGIATGLSLTLRLDRVLGLDLTSPTALRFDSAPAAIWVQVLCGALGAAAAAITMRCRPRHVLPCAALGALALLLVSTLPTYAALGATTAVAVAAVAVGLLGRLVGMRLGAPGLVIVIPTVSPLLPGLRIFRGMYDAVAGTIVGSQAVAGAGQALGTLLGAASVALAISTGVFFGDAVATPLDRPVVRQRRARRR
ncbi:threonine/serine exporter family protein [Calidifontibacter sp. DB0510]|uniref:Threonine/serine exporter family protein n=1 Tax=Metallococcus carri TaxID=1656884 RepID=A0A967EA62_9MICO|nr:threonine/serine exporter family protein [Metallococcus carri]NHN55549.1 threonine/serine exporter family protein [Metallococcus carri]NOP38267.1 threonine/serine exporter family protein [Calidifontibacter sp. DB2511S]